MSGKPLFGNVGAVVEVLPVASWAMGTPIFVFSKVLLAFFSLPSIAVALLLSNEY